MSSGTIALIIGALIMGGMLYIANHNAHIEIQFYTECKKSNWTATLNNTAYEMIEFEPTPIINCTHEYNNLMGYE
jgi:hypothetical protein